MAQVSYGTITITDITDIDNIQNYYLATSASSGVTTSTSGWTTGIQSMTSTNQYLWNYEQILGTGGVVINTTTPVIIGRYGQNGQPGVSITSIDEYYKANNSSTTKPTSWNAVNVIDKPTASNKYLWNYQVIHYSNNTTEGSASEARIIGVYGDKGEKGDDGISPTVSKSGNTVTITDAEGNTVTVSDGTNGISYYTHIRYATSSAGANMTSTPTSSTIYIGIYSGTSATAPTTANSYTWSKYMGTNGTDGISVTKVTPIYYLKTSSGSIPTAPNSGTAITSTSTGTGVWTTAIPTYVNGGTYYTSTQTYLSGGTSPVSSTAVIDQALTTANSNAYGAYNIATGINQHFWSIESDYATGIPAGSYITDTIIDTFKSNKTGGNLLTRSDGIWIRNGIQTLASLTGDALQFYNPSDSNHPLQLSIGANGTLQSGNYTRGSDSKFSSNGTKIDLINGDIITKYFRVSQGLESDLNAGVYVHGTIEALDGTIGTDSTNYWEIGNGTDYNLNSTAKMIGHGSSYIQLGDSSTWRLATNRIHTGWYTSNDSLLHFPTINSKYWDFGIHVPVSGTDKFLYIRSSKANTSASNALQNLLYDIDDTYATAQWDYPFYIDGAGNVHAPAYYVGSEPLTGGVGSIAEKIINSDSTYGKGSLTQPIYIDSNGRPATTTYALNAAGAKGIVTNIANNTSSTDLPTTAAVVSYVTSRGYITSYTDNKVQTSQANTTKIFLAGTSTSGTSTGTLSYDSNVYLTTTAGTLHATTFEGNLSGTATKANQDGDGNVIKTTYLKLSGGNVTGAVSFGSSVSADELTVGDLVVNGAASFTNNLQANTINGVEVGSNPKFTDTTYTFANGTNGFTVTPSGGEAQTVTVTPSISNNITGTGTRTSGYLAKFSGTNTITNGPAIGTGTTKFLREDGTWVVPAGTGVTSVAASGSGGITISGSPITTSGTITIGLNLSTAINGLSEGASPATRDDYAVMQYAGGGTTTTSYHRRKLSNVFAALNSSDITTALGYTPYNSTNPNGYITANHTSTYSLPIAKYNTLGGVKPAYSSTGAATLTTAAATNTTTPTIAAKTTTSGRYYAIEIDKNGILFVNVPWTNVNSSYLTSSSSLAWDKITGKPTTASGYGITDAITNVTATSASGGSTTFTLTKSNNTTSTFDVVVYASAATQATDANYLTNGTTRYTVGNAKKPIYFDGGIPKASDGTEGTSTKPVYLSSGTLTAGSTYAGGTKVTLNNSDKGASTASFYAPTSGGTTAQVLTGNGTTSAPVWTAISSLVPSTATNATNDSDGNPINSTYLKKSGGVMTGSISRAGVSTNWNKGRDNALIKTTSLSGYSPLWSAKTNNGSWDVGTYNNASFTDDLIFTYITDTDYSGENKATAQIKFMENGHIVASEFDGNASSASSVSWSGVTSKPTTLSGYGITDALPLAGGTLTGELKIKNGGMWVQGGSEAGGNYNRMTLTRGMPTELKYNGSKRGTRIYSNAIALADPYNGNSNNDAGWIRHIEETANSGTLEIATGDDANESIVVRQYNASSAIARELILLNSSGNSSFPGTVTATTFSGNATSATSLNGGTALSSKNLNDYHDTSGKLNYYYAGGSNSCTNVPIGDGTQFGMITYNSAGGHVAQELSSFSSATNKGKWIRWWNSSSWSSWEKFLTSANYSDYTVTKTGSGASGTWGISITGNAANVTGTVAIANGGTGLTTSPSMLTNLGSTTAANVLQASPRPGITGTLGAANGGTGQTSLVNAANSLLNSLTTGSSTPVDNDYYISQYVGGGTTTTTYHRRPMSALWSYISGKISSSGTYVTVNTNQTLTAAGTKTYLGLQTYGSNGIALGVTSGTSVIQKANMHYDSTLEAIVFSFA